MLPVNERSRSIKLNITGMTFPVTLGNGTTQKVYISLFKCAIGCFGSFVAITLQKNLASFGWRHTINFGRPLG